MDNVLDNILEQHSGIKKDLLSIEKLFESSGNSKKIFVLLEKFLVDLKTHLKTENDIFYPELLKRMGKKKLSTQETKQFIAEMKDIEKEINSFSGKIKKAEDIERDFENFKKEFLAIKEAVFLRVDSEEDGVFIYY